MKLTTEQIKQLIKEELSVLLEESVTRDERKRAKSIKFNNVTFLVIPLTNEELERAQPKHQEPEVNYEGIYRIKYEKDAKKTQHLYNAARKNFTDKELESYGIDPKGSINLVAYISHPKPEDSKAVYQAIRNFLLMR